jgi:hypothetical protein
MFSEGFEAWGVLVGVIPYATVLLHHVEQLCLCAVCVPRKEKEKISKRDVESEK